MRKKPITREQILKFASRKEGFVVHIYKWGQGQERRLANRMHKEGLLTRHRCWEYFIFRVKRQEGVTIGTKRVCGLRGTDTTKEGEGSSTR